VPALAESPVEESAALRLLRTYADALRQLTQAEVELYESQVEEPLRQAGATEQDLLDTSGMTGAQLSPLLQQTLMALYRRHRQHVWLDHSIGHLDASSKPWACTGAWTPRHVCSLWT
jgi:hypothetical protein